MIPPSRLDTYEKVISVLSGKLRYSIGYEITTRFFSLFFPSYIAVSLQFELYVCTLLWLHLILKKCESQLVLNKSESML